MKDYWIPRTKHDLVAWLAMWYKRPASHFNRMPKKQLYAIYHKSRQAANQTRLQT